MNSNTNESSNIDEISFKELFFVIYKHKIFIGIITLVTTLLAGLYSILIITPVYDSKLNIVISMPETFITRFGEYKLPLSSNQQYINLINSNNVIINTLKDMGYDSRGVSTDDLKARIRISNINNTSNAILNSFDVTVSANNPQEAKKLADTLYENFIEFLDVMTKERAINYYYDQFTVQRKTLLNSIKFNNEILKQNEQLLADMSQTINQKEALEEISERFNSKDFVILEDIINPNYTKLEGDILNLKQVINSDEITLQNYNDYLSELDIEKKAINKYYTSSNNESLESSVTGIIENSVYMPSPPIAPINKTSPSNALNAIIGGILGGLFSLLIIFSREYLFTRRSE
jgi:capsular polysaccharide biosynthesis protein